MDASRILAVSGSPFVFNTLHVPLVDDNDDSFLIALVNLLEELLVSLINENALKLREVDIQRLNVPVHQVWVQTFLCKLTGLTVVQTHCCLVQFVLPRMMTPIHNSLINVVRNIHSCLVEQSSPGGLIEFWTQKVKLCICLLGLFASKLHFKTWLVEVEAAWNAEVKLKHPRIKVITEPEEIGPRIRLPFSKVLI